MFQKRADAKRGRPHDIVGPYTLRTYAEQHTRCRTCECYDKCLPRYCCGFPASNLMQWRFRLINTLIALVELRKIPDAQAAQVAAVDDELDALYEELANASRQTGRCTRHRP